MPVSPNAKQFIVALSPILAGLAVGGAVTFPTILLHQLKAEDSIIQLDFDTASWIGSIQGLAGLPSILMPMFMQWQGRKLAFIAAGLISITGWILTFAATNLTLLFISECFHGVGNSSIFIVTCLSVTEMIAPKYRDAIIQLYFCAHFVAMAALGLLVQYLHWKTISIIMCVPMIFAVLVAWGWPESPYWLALKGQFQKSEEAFLWLRGSDPESMKELYEIINSKKNSKNEGKVTTHKNDIKGFWKQISSRDFYIPFFHMTVFEFVLQGTGSVIIIIYSIELFKKTTTNETVIFFAGFIVNSIMLLGFISHLCITKYFMKKTIILCSLFCTSVSIFSAAVVSYLQTLGYLSDSILCLLCLIVFIMSVSTGLMPLAHSISSSLMPVRHRGIGGILFIMENCLFHSLALKMAPYMFLYIDMWGTYLVFAMVGILNGFIIWKFIPETKDRTLQEIDNYYTYGKFCNAEDDNLQSMIDGKNLLDKT